MLDGYLVFWKKIYKRSLRRGYVIIGKPFGPTLAR